MRIGVIGAGNWGKNLIRTLHHMGVLGGFAEMSEPLRADVSRSYPAIPAFSEHKDLLASPVEAVVIATPVATHHPVASEALLAGKDVFVEKPLAMTEKEARDLADLAVASGRVLMVGHLLLYQPAIRWIKSQFGNETVGELRSLHQERLNLGKARSVENALWSLGAHDVAVLLYLVGASPTHTFATGQRILQPTVEDDVYLHLVFENGVRAHLHNSWLWPEKRRGLTVVGTRGMLVYDEITQTVTLHRKSIDTQLQNSDQGSEVVFRGEGEPLRLEMEHFVACVRDRARPLSDGESGAEVVRVLEIASRSINS